MLVVRFREDSRNRLSSFVAEGHAGFADAGEDIVCAGASAILQATLLGLTAHARVDVQEHREPGIMTMRWPIDSRDRPDVAAIVATAALSIEALARQFPSHVRFSREPEESDG